MTRDFSNQRRDNMRPAPRTNPGSYREDQPSRSMRPRLSRDTVDRAWENGAIRKYADYRARPNAPTPHDQRQGRPSPRFERPRPYEQSEHERRDSDQGPYARRQGGQRPPSSFDRNRPPREQRFAGEQGRRFQESDYRTSGNNERPGNGYRTPGNNERPGNDYHSRQAPPRREYERGGYRDHYQNERPPRFSNDTGPREETDERGRHPADRSFHRSGPWHPRDRDEQNPRPFEHRERTREHFAHGRRNSGAPYPQRDSSHPRWQSRPAAQREAQDREPWQERPAFRQPQGSGRPAGARFEGDYEHYTTDTPQRAPRPEQTYRQQTPPPQDGRAFKGSRPGQEDAGRFWHDIEDETASLLDHPPVEPAETARPVSEQLAPRPHTPQALPEGQTGKVKMVKTTHARTQDHGKAKTSKKKPSARGPVMYPSQRGYKWPAAGE